MAAQPSKYSTQYADRVDSNTIWVVMFDKSRGNITRFVVQLQEQITVKPPQTKTFAQIDHEPGNPEGHDLYDEGIHVDIYHVDGSTSTIKPVSLNLPGRPGVLLKAAKDYLIYRRDYFRQAARNEIDISSPPKFDQ